MTLTIDVDLSFCILALVGVAFLLLSVLRGLEIVRLGNPTWLAASPLATALNGVAVFLIAIMSDIRNSGHDWLAFGCFFVFVGLLVSSLVLESRARADLTPNQSLQPTVDSAGSPADAGAPSASTASEPRRYSAQPIR